MISFQEDYLDQNKIFAHLGRLEEWLSKGKTMPVMIELDATNVCNYNCPKCSGNKFSPNKALSPEFMKSIVDQVKTFARSIVFTGGGEPLCNKQTANAIEYASKKGLDVGLITNGSLIAKSDYKTLIRCCKWIRASIDADSNADYQKIHGTDKTSLGTVWKNIALLAKAKKESGSSCTIGVSYLVNRHNEKGILPFTKKARRTGLDYAQFKPFHYSKFFPKASLEKAKKLETKNFKVLASMHRFVKEEGPFGRCFKDEFVAAITAEGKMYPCCFTKGIDEFCFGDLNKESFAKIWNSNKRKEVSERKLKSKNCPVMCKYEPLNKLLWKIYKVNKEGVHRNFL